MPSVLNDWVTELSYMQQSVLLAMVRNEDGLPKHHPQKELIKWFRRCILKSAFDGVHMTMPNTPGGGSFTGPVENVHVALDNFIWARDEMKLHYFAHAMHAFEILGYHYPNIYWRKFWHEAYHRMVAALHMMPESKYEMDKRLCDNIDTWRAREDKCGGCTSTEPKNAQIPFNDDVKSRLMAMVEDAVSDIVAAEFNSDVECVKHSDGSVTFSFKPGTQGSSEFSFGAEEPGMTWAEHEAAALGDELDVRNNKPRDAEAVLDIGAELVIGQTYINNGEECIWDGEDFEPVHPTATPKEDRSNTPPGLTTKFGGVV